jgi:cysteine desulfurase
VAGWVVWRYNVLVIYFDHNATAPLLPVARETWLRAVEAFPANPSSPHRLGHRADHALNDAREMVAKVISCDPLDLVWTSGATESANLAMHHFSRTMDPADEVWISAIEHPAVLQTAHHYFGRQLVPIPADGQGLAQLDWVEERLRVKRPAFIAVMAANNETGVLQPWTEIARTAQEREIPFICDATQWLGKLSGHGLGECDFVIGSGHKFGGPRGVGFLKCPRKGKVEALLHGGPQEEGRRAGTENVAGVLAMSAALESREAQVRDGGVPPRLEWRVEFERRLGDALGDVRVLGRTVERLWNTVSVVMPGIDCRKRWVVKLDREGFAVSTGSACASGKEKASHVMEAMRLTNEAGRVIRISSGWETRWEDWSELLRAIARIHDSWTDPVARS